MKQLHEVFLSILSNAQDLRGQLGEMYEKSGKEERQWVAFERFFLLGIVNAYRKVNGFPEVTEADIERCEYLACGHVDYSRKLALFCSWLAQDKLELIKEW